MQKENKGEKLMVEIAAIVKPPVLLGGVAVAMLVGAQSKNPEIYHRGDRRGRGV